MAKPLKDFRMQALADAKPADMRRREEFNTVRQVRFGSPELWITVAIVLIAAALLFPLTNAFVARARQSTYEENVHAIYIAVFSAINLEPLAQADKDEFFRKYQTPTQVTQLVKGTQPVEQAVAARLSSNNMQLSDTSEAQEAYTIPLKGYVQILRTDSGEISVQLTSDSSAETSLDCAVYPN